MYVQMLTQCKPVQQLSFRKRPCFPSVTAYANLRYDRYIVGGGIARVEYDLK